MHVYLIYDQQFRNKGGKALTEEKKKTMHASDMVSEDLANS